MDKNRCKKGKSETPQPKSTKKQLKSSDNQLQSEKHKRMKVNEFSQNRKASESEASKSSNDEQTIKAFQQKQRSDGLNYDDSSGSDSNNPVSSNSGLNMFDKEYVHSRSVPSFNPFALTDIDQMIPMFYDSKKFYCKDPNLKISDDLLIKHRLFIPPKPVQLISQKL